MSQVKYPLAVIAVFVWVGFVCAISFMEAWIKFRAPGISLSLGLGIGRLVFSALNKVEWVLAIAVIINYVLDSKRSFHRSYVVLLIAVLILLVQTFYALPALDARAELHIKGLPVPPSYLHLYYVIMEAIKVCCLVVFGARLFKMTKVIV